MNANRSSAPHSCFNKTQHFSVNRRPLHIPQEQRNLFSLPGLQKQITSLYSCSPAIDVFYSSGHQHLFSCTFKFSWTFLWLDRNFKWVWLMQNAEMWSMQLCCTVMDSFEDQLAAVRSIDYWLYEMIDEEFHKGGQCRGAKDLHCLASKNCWRWLKKNKWLSINSGINSCHHKLVTFYCWSKSIVNKICHIGSNVYTV